MTEILIGAALAIPVAFLGFFVGVALVAAWPATIAVLIGWLIFC